MMGALFGKLLGNPWTLVAIAVVSFGAGAYTAHQFSKANELAALQKKFDAQKAVYAERDIKFAEQARLDAQLDSRNAVLRDTNAELEQKLKEAIAHRPFTIREAPTDAIPCPPITRGPDYRLCYNAAVSGDAAALAACQAGSGHESVPGESVRTP